MNIRNKEGKINYKELFIQSGLYLVLFCMLLVIIWKEPSFLSIRNFKNILTQSSVRAIIALGVVGLILTQGTLVSRATGRIGGCYFCDNVASGNECESSVWLES